MARRTVLVSFVLLLTVVSIGIVQFLLVSKLEDLDMNRKSHRLVAVTSLRLALLCTIWYGTSLCGLSCPRRKRSRIIRKGKGSPCTIPPPGFSFGRRKVAGTFRDAITVVPYQSNGMYVPPTYVDHDTAVVGTITGTGGIIGYS